LKYETSLKIKKYISTYGTISINVIVFNVAGEGMIIGQVSHGRSGRQTQALLSM